MSGSVPGKAEQVLQQSSVVIRLGSLPPRVLTKGEEGASPPVSAPGEQHQLLLNLPAHIPAPKPTHSSWACQQHPVVLRSKVRVGTGMVVVDGSRVVVPVSTTVAAVAPVFTPRIHH